MIEGRRSSVGTRSARVAGLAVVGLLASGVVFAAPASAAPSVKQLREQAQQLQRQLDQLNVQQDLAVEQYDAAQDALLQATTGEVSASVGVSDGERAAQASEDQAAQRVRAIYLSGGPVGLTATMLGSRSLGDALVRWQAIEGIVADDAQQVGVRQAAVVRQRQVQLAADRDRAVVVARQQAADQAAAAVARAIAQQRQVLDSTNAQVVALAQQEQQQREAQALARAAQAAHDAGIGGIGSGSVNGVTDAAGSQLRGSSSGDRTLPDVPAPNSVAAAAIAAAASRIGRPYVWGANGPDTFDCSGLMQWAYAQAGVKLPRTSRAQYAALTHVPLSQLAPGDLVFYATDVSRPATIHHVGMYLGDGLSLYAPETGSVVKIGPVSYEPIIGAARPTL